MTAAAAAAPQVLLPDPYMQLQQVNGFTGVLALSMPFCAVQQCARWFARSCATGAELASAPVSTCASVDGHARERSAVRAALSHLQESTAVLCCTTGQQTSSSSQQARW